MKLRLLLIVTFFLIACLHLSSVNSELNGLGGDNARYIFVAKSLALGEGFRDFFPGSPPHVHYPPVFSLMLAPVIWLLGVNFAACHAVVVASELTALAFLFFFFKRIAGWTLAFLVCLIFSLNPFINLFLAEILSEFPYLMITAAALLLAEKFTRPDNRKMQYLWIPLLVSSAYLMKSAGLMLILAFCCYRLYRKEFRVLLWNLPLLFLPRLLWALRTWSLDIEGGTGYLKVFGLKNRTDPGQGDMGFVDLLERVRLNIKLISQTLVEFVIPSQVPASWPIILFLGGFVLIGFWARFKEKKAGFMEFYVVLYLGMLALWPVYEHRKFFPIVPFLYFYLLYATDWLIRTRQNYWRSAIVWTLGLFILSGQIQPTLEVSQIRSRPLFFPPPSDPAYNGFTVDWSHHFTTYDWLTSGTYAINAELWGNYLYLSHAIGKTSPPGSAIIARKPGLTALYSDRPAIDFPFFNDFELQRKHILKNKIGYVLLDGMFHETFVYLWPFIQANPAAFEVIDQKGNAMVLKVLREKL